jgi:hypothetical protein
MKKKSRSKIKVVRQALKALTTKSGIPAARVCR